MSYLLTSHQPNKVKWAKLKSRGRANTQHHPHHHHPTLPPIHEATARVWQGCGYIILERRGELRSVIHTPAVGSPAIPQPCTTSFSFPLFSSHLCRDPGKAFSSSLQDDFPFIQTRSIVFLSKAQHISSMKVDLSHTFPGSLLRN